MLGKAGETVCFGYCLLKNRVDLFNFLQAFFFFLCFTLRTAAFSIAGGRGGGGDSTTGGGEGDDGLTVEGEEVLDLTDEGDGVDSSMEGEIGSTAGGEGRGKAR